MFTTFFSTLAGIASLNVAITEFINTKFNVTNSLVKQIISWIIPILISVFGLVFGLGVFASYGTICEVPAWIYTILTGFGIGLASNGIYDIKYIKNILDMAKELLNSKVNK